MINAKNHIEIEKSNCLFVGNQSVEQMKEYFNGKSILRSVNQEYISKLGAGGLI